MSLSRAELQAMDRDELVEAIVGLADRVEDLEAELQTVKETQDSAGQDRAAIRQTITDAQADLAGEIDHQADLLHRERSKLARRVAALEDEVGVTATDALAVAEGGEDATHLTKLGRLIRHGPEAVTDRPTERLYRARDLVDNWNRWGTVRDDALGRERRLASNKHDLLTRLEDARGESLSWRQVYRAMETVAEYSEGDVDLVEGSDEEGKYVLVHRLTGGESG